jgi:FkbM family methyltransferase
MAAFSLLLNRIKHGFYSITRSKKYLIADCKPYNLKFKFALADGLGRDIYYKQGVYSEDYITQHLLNHLDLKQEDLILDIGANIGWYSLVLGSATKATILAFEPDKQNFRLLSENIAMNACSGIKAYNKAVSDHEGILTLHLYKGYNTGRHSFIKQKNSVGTLEVPIIELDSFLENEGYINQPIKLLKIDIEGYEMTALHKAFKTLARTQWILTEFSPDLMEAAEQNPMEYIQILQKAGFQLQEINETGLHQPDFDAIVSQKKQVNLLGKR